MINGAKGTVQQKKSDFKLTEKCAVFGMFGSTSEAARVTYYGLSTLQHRGQESSGIVSSDGKKMHRHTGTGLVANVYNDDDISELKGHLAIGHNRYATSGGSSDFYNQPFLHVKKQFALAHNGNLPICDKLIEFLKMHNISTDKLNDTQLMEATIGQLMDAKTSLEQAIAKAYPLFTGAFSAVAMDKTKLIAFRDACGIRPLSIGKLEDGGYVVASETCAFDTVGATFERDVLPGELVVIDQNGITSHQVVKGRQKLDIFEFVYFARPDSIMLGQRVNEVRIRFGHEMAKEFPIEADTVVPVPDSSIPAALGYAQVSGIPYDMALIKNRYIHRTFIQPTQEMRKRAVKMKLNPIRESFEGKRIILVDDSIVRGTTMREVVRMIREAGAKEIHLVISSPPVLYPDYYGINTPTQAELIATRMNLAEIREHMGADSLNYLSLEGMVRATNIPVGNFSMSCFDGVYPIPIGDRAKEFEKINFSQVSSLPSTKNLAKKTKQYKLKKPAEAIA